MKLDYDSVSQNLIIKAPERYTKSEVRISYYPAEDDSGQTIIVCDILSMGYSFPTLNITMPADDFKLFVETLNSFVKDVL